MEQEGVEKIGDWGIDERSSTGGFGAGEREILKERVR
jgi:hypothetical protein